MANETEWTKGAEVVLESAGVSAAAAAFMPATDATLSSANHSNYPFADVAMMISGFGGTLASTGSLGFALWRRDVNFDTSAGDEGVPTASNKAHYMGWLNVPLSAASNAVHYTNCTDIAMPGGDAEVYLENLTGATTAAGWTLKFTPKTYAPGT